MDAGNTYTKYQNLLLSILPSHKLIDTSRKPSSQNQRNPNPTSKRFPKHNVHTSNSMSHITKEKPSCSCSYSLHVTNGTKLNSKQAWNGEAIMHVLEITFLDSKIH